MKNRFLNFGAGPAMLPLKILNQIKKDLYNWNNIGISIIEASHRSKEFINLANECENNLRNILNIPSNYKILFCHGGARAQFAFAPINLLNNNYKLKSDYINSGFWSYKAALEGSKYSNVNIINVIEYKKNKLCIKPINSWNISNNSYFIHYCINETINGLTIYEEPNFKKLIISDFSSFFLSQPIDINKYGIIYACSQKNTGIAGLTIVIIRDDLLFYNDKIPSVFNYKLLSKHNSMLNTPPIFPWYVTSIMLKWIISKGGLKNIYKSNKKKSNILYNFIDNSNFYINNISKKNRSIINIVFNLYDKKLNELFIKKALNNGICSIKGHSNIGGMRISLYNSMPLSGVKKLLKFMTYFEEKYG